MRSEILFLVLLLSLTTGQFVSRPIADPLSNQELTLSGYSFNGFQVPHAYGWCKTNSDCSNMGSPKSFNTCYSQFYVNLDDEGNPTNTSDYTFPHCSKPGLIDFTNYNMTYFARLYLLYLDQNLASFIGGDPVCESIASDVCYLQMWAQNIRNGFACNNTQNTFMGGNVLPPCKSYCTTLMHSNCNSTMTALMYHSQTSLQFCELFPSKNCYSDGNVASPIFVVILFISLLTFLLL